MAKINMDSFVASGTYSRCQMYPADNSFELELKGEYFTAGELQEFVEELREYMQWMHDAQEAQVAEDAPVYKPRH